MLEDEAYRVLSADVAMGQGGREGQVILVLPAEGRGDRPALSSDAGEAAPHFSQALQAQVMQADCRLDAVVGRMTLPLRQIMALTVGETLLLPSSALDAITVETIEGRRVAGARLGQHRGMRALKLSEAVALTTSANPRVSSSVAEVSPPELRAAG
jgi:flagellar motor switch protein FliM